MDFSKNETFPYLVVIQQFENLPFKNYIGIPLSQEEEDSVNIKESQGANEVADQTIPQGCNQGLIGVDFGFQKAFF